MSNRSRWNALKIKRPLIQGGMGIGISLSGLAGAVAKEGGIGMISAAQIGFREPDFDRKPLEANLRAMKTELEKARAIAPDGIIGFNIMKAMFHYEQYVKTAVEIGADIIVTGAGLPVDLPQIVLEAEQETGAKRPLLAPIVSTDKAANVILKYWDKKYGIMPDILVIEGPKAGGHLGFSPEQLEEFSSTDSYSTDSDPTDSCSKDFCSADSGPTDSCSTGSGGDRYDAEIRKILMTVRSYEEKYGCTIVTALGGGISTKEDADHAFELGADLIQVATRFVTTHECDADIRYKQAYLDAQEQDILIVKSPVGMPGRALKNTFMERVMAGEQIPHSPCHGCLAKCRPAEIPYCITDALVHAAKGETEDALLFCGADAYKAKCLETVKEVIDSLLQ